MKLFFQYFFITLTLSIFIFASPYSMDKVEEERRSDRTKHISIRTFEKELDQIYKEITQKSLFNANNCDEYITNITNFLLLQSSTRYLPLTQKDFRRLEKRADIIVEKLFSLRLLLHKKLKEFYLQGKITPSCVKKMRMAFRYSRFMEEFITEIRVSMYKRPMKADRRDFSQEKYQFYLNPKYKDSNFKSGDVLLVRTSSFVSAVIARIGDDDGQFSHAAMIYVDERGEVKVIEALIALGTIITPYEEWRKTNDHSRALLFRHDNEALAKKAALKLYNIVQKRQVSNDLILYDFTMDDSDSNKIFCAELIQYAFKLAGDSQMPTFRTSFKAFDDHPFLHELTISAKNVFAPGDIEVEPFLNLVAEWRNYDSTRLSRIQDVIQTKVLYWMSYEDYYLKGTFRSSFGTTVGLLGRRLFGLNSDNVPLNMPYGFMENIIKLHDLSDLLEKHLLKEEMEYFKKYGHSMDYLMMMNELEKFRVEDCRRYINRKKEMKDRILYHIDDWEKPYKGADPIFHPLFNTKNELECNTQVEGF